MKFFTKQMDDSEKIIEKLKELKKVEDKNVEECRKEYEEIFTKVLERIGQERWDDDDVECVSVYLQ